jgi:23S rRNA (adenine2503-C2)-methyltransferase
MEAFLLKIVGRSDNHDIATVYIGEFDRGKYVEFVESIQPPFPRKEKWVFLVSVLYGCPVRCSMCDAGGDYSGPLSKEDIFAQIDYLARSRYPDAQVPAKKFKIQFARMGEPTLNPAVIEVLRELPTLYPNPGLLPALSTVAPIQGKSFMEKLLQVKQRLYQDGRFQLQFSIHSTDNTVRDRIIPVEKWSFEEIAAFGERFWQEGDRKITLNFAVAKGFPFETDILKKHFDPNHFLIKITPVNPTYEARKNSLESYIDPHEPDAEYSIVSSLKKAGFDVIVSIGEVEENHIGSNCGQYVRRHMKSKIHLENAYLYNKHIE